MLSAHVLYIVDKQQANSYKDPQTFLQAQIPNMLPG